MWSPSSEEGVPQGGPVSPVLSNIYLHYVLDLWFERRFKKTCRGYAELTRFADDFVAAFRNHADAGGSDRKWKSGWQPSGCGSRRRRQRCCASTASLLQGNGRPAKKPDTFTFLGFTHFRARTRAGQHVGEHRASKHANGSSQESPSGYGSTATKASGNTRRI